MKQASFAFTMVLAATLITACGDRQQGSATPQAAEEFAALQQLPLNPEEPLDKEWADVLRHFEKHTDVHYTSTPSGLNILHLAAMFNKAELVRCLLLDGADPNARTHFFDGADTAIEMALADISHTSETPARADAITATIDNLLQGGAKPENEEDIVVNAISLCEHEQAAMHLLKKLPPALLRESEAYQVAAWKGWKCTLDFLLHNHKPAKEQLDQALIAAAAGSYLPQGQHAECISLLLKQGADVNARDNADRTPLFAAATILLQTESAESDRVLEIIIFLLQHGADIALNSKDEEYPDCNAYDLLLMHPSALAKLAQRGHHLQAPPLDFLPGPSLLSDVCKTKFRKYSAEEMRRHFDTIAGILTPTPEMEASPIYTEALENAIILLSQVDCVRTTQLVARLPIWQQPDRWTTHEHTTQAVMAALRNTPAIILPPELLQHTARNLITRNMNDEAATLIEWLGRDTNALPLVEKLTEDTNPAIRAGAWAAKLQQNGLPLPRDGEVRTWLQNHPQVNPHHPVLQKALLLTSLEALWYGDMPKERQQQLIATMRDIGATRAAAQYEKIAQNLHHPDVLDSIMAQPDDWKFELEIATAQYIFSHRDTFLTPQSENTD